MVAYDREMNRVFSTCIDVQSIAQRLRDTAPEVTMLTRVGIVNAGRIGAGEGRRLLALTQCLTDLPRAIAPETEALLGLSDALTRATAECANLARLNYQEVGALVAMSGRPVVFRSYPIETELREVVAPALGSAASAGSFRDTAERLCARTGANVERLIARLHESRGLVRRMQRHSESLRRVGEAGRHLGSCFAIEAAKVDGGSAEFADLSVRLRALMRQVDELLDEISAVASRGDGILHSLLREVDRR